VEPGLSLVSLHHFHPVLLVIRLVLIRYDPFVRDHQSRHPAKAGSEVLAVLDSGFRRNDGEKTSALTGAFHSEPLFLM